MFNCIGKQFLFGFVLVVSSSLCDAAEVGSDERLLRATNAIRATSILLKKAREEAGPHGVISGDIIGSLRKTLSKDIGGEEVLIAFEDFLIKQNVNWEDPLWSGYLRLCINDMQVPGRSRINKLLADKRLSDHQRLGIFEVLYGLLPIQPDSWLDEEISVALLSKFLGNEERAFECGGVRGKQSYKIEIRYCDFAADRLREYFGADVIEYSLWELESVDFNARDTGIEKVKKWTAEFGARIKLRNDLFEQLRNWRSLQGVTPFETMSARIDRTLKEWLACERHPAIVVPGQPHPNSGINVRPGNSLYFVKRLIELYFGELRREEVKNVKRGTEETAFLDDVRKQLGVRLAQFGLSGDFTVPHESLAMRSVLMECFLVQSKKHPNYWMGQELRATGQWLNELNLDELIPAK